MKHGRISAYGAALFAACVAQAAQMSPARPLLVPDRDVTVEYMVTPEGHAPMDVVVAISAGGRRLHITSQDLPTTILVDRDTETADILLPMLRAYAELRIGRYDPERTILNGASFSRGERTQLARPAMHGMARGLQGWQRRRLHHARWRDPARRSALQPPRPARRRAGAPRHRGFAAGGDVPGAARFPEKPVPLRSAGPAGMNRPAPLAGMALAGMAVAACLAWPAWADAPPAVRPTRDVDVTYRVPVGPGDATSLLQRLRFSAALHRQRVDLPTSGTWMVIDFAAHTMAMVRDSSREVVDLPAPDSASLPQDGAAFQRMGSASVAGLDCTEWRTRDTRGAETIACYTPDGVMLRARTDTRLLMEATGVHYAALPGGIFVPPDGYSHQRAGAPQ